MHNILMFYLFHHLNFVVNLIKKFLQLFPCFLDLNLLHSNYLLGSYVYCEVDLTKSSFAKAFVKI